MLISLTKETISTRKANSVKTEESYKNVQEKKKKSEDLIFKTSDIN